MALFTVRVEHFVPEATCTECPQIAQLRADIADLKETLMATQAELAVELQNVTAAVDKIGSETRSLITKISDLEAALADAGATTPEVDAALAALKDQVAVVDALVPDAQA